MDRYIEMKRIKILFIIQDLQHGGAEKVLVNLANNLNRSMFEVSIKTLFDKGVNKSAILDHVKYLPGLKWEFRGNSKLIRFLPSRWLYRFFVKDDYDVVVAFLEGTATKVLSGCTREGTKKIAWVHIEMNSIRTCFLTTKIALREYNKFDNIVCVSNSVKTAFEKAAGISFKQIQVLYNVNETKAIIELSKEPVDDMTFEKEKINLISVAKLVTSKGYDRLISALNRLKCEGLTNLHLYLIGIGEKQSDLEAMVRKNGLDEMVSFLGFKNNPYKYVSKADLYICSSRREGFSTAVTEALVLGVPVISTCCSGAYELLGQADEYGLVVDNSEEGIYKGIKQMILPGQLGKYREKAAKRGRQFSTEKTVKAVEDMLLNL